MTEWWYYVVAIFVGVLLVNGIPHFTNGVSGRRFPTVFTRGVTDDTAVRNVIWGALNWIIGGVLLWVIRDGLSNVIIVAEMVVFGLAFALGLASRFGATDGKR